MVLISFRSNYVDGEYSYMIAFPAFLKDFP